jgi:hypothetical protein
MTTAYDSVPTSLLSARLVSVERANTTFREHSEPVPFECTEEMAKPSGDGSTSVEPPFSLEEGNKGNGFGLMKQMRYSCPNSNRNPALTYQLPLDLAASPLTSCSYQTIGKEYDMDTWRMYERIQSTRDARRSGEQYLSIARDTPAVHIQCKDRENTMYGRLKPDLTHCEVKQDDFEGIFELDL